MEKKCALYLVTHRESGKSYVGISVDPIDRWRVHKRLAKRGRGECPRFYNALAKYGHEAFEWKVIAYASCFAGAAKLEKLAIALGYGHYNLTSGGEGQPDPAPETRDKMSKKAKGRAPPNKGQKASPEVCAKISAASKNRPPIKDETRRKLSEAGKRRPKTSPTEDQRRRISQTLMGNIPWNKGKTFSEEAKKNMSLAHLGKKDSEETKAKKRAAMLGRPGKKHTEESKAKISASRKGKGTGARKPKEPKCPPESS